MISFERQIPSLEFKIQFAQDWSQHCFSTASLITTVRDCVGDGRWLVGMAPLSYGSFAYSAWAHFTVEGPGVAEGLESAGQCEGDPIWGRRRSRASSPRARRGIFAATRRLTRGPSDRRSGSDRIGAYVTLCRALYHLLGDFPGLVRASCRSIGAGKHLQNAGIVVHSPRLFELKNGGGGMEKSDARRRLATI